MNYRAAKYLFLHFEFYTVSFVRFLLYIPYLSFFSPSLLSRERAKQIKLLTPPPHVKKDPLATSESYLVALTLTRSSYKAKREYQYQYRH